MNRDNQPVGIILNRRDFVKRAIYIGIMNYSSIDEIMKYLLKKEYSNKPNKSKITSASYIISNRRKTYSN